MSSVLLTGSSRHWMSSIGTANTLASATSMPILGNYRDNRCFRYSCWNWDEKRKRPKFAPTLIGAHKKRRLCLSAKASSALATTRNSSHPNFYQEVIEVAREKFTQEISFRSKDKDISLAKALLYVAAEDEAFRAFNREIDARSRQCERRDALVPSNAQEWDSMEVMALAGKSINEWLNELDTIAKEVEAELVSRDIGCHLVEVLQMNMPKDFYVY